MPYIFNRFFLSKYSLLVDTLLLNILYYSSLLLVDDLQEGQSLLIDGLFSRHS